MFESTSLDETILARIQAGVAVAVADVLSRARAEADEARARAEEEERRRCQLAAAMDRIRAVLESVGAVPKARLLDSLSGLKRVRMDAIAHMTIAGEIVQFREEGRRESFVCLRRQPSAQHAPL